MTSSPSIARLSSGAPFTPIVASDINADGARNDRAFIFDPTATSDTSVAVAMRRLIGQSTSRVADCLTSQLGEVAGVLRNDAAAAAGQQSVARGPLGR